MPYSTHQFAEKVSLITDGSSPIGRAAALQLALLGSYVIVGYPDISAAEQSAVQELQRLGTLADAVEADITTADGAGRLIAGVENKFGRLDLLVNCLKSKPESSYLETTEREFADALDKNLKAAFFVTQAAVQLMISRPKPKIVNVISACDTPEAANNVLHSTLQAAMAGFTKALAESLPPHFRVNGVEVSEKESPVETEHPELFRKTNALSFDDAARTIVYLLSSEAIGLNGQVLQVS